MNKNELDLILEQHRLWLNNDGGKRANLRSTDLSGANLRSTDLSGADLSGANLSYANLSYANLSGADLSGANLRSTDLSYAILSGANLSGANLSYAILSGADLDFSQLNLSCKGLDFKIDERLAKQLVYHVINLMQYSELDTSKIFKKQVYKWLEDSHLVTEHDLPKLEDK